MLIIFPLLFLVFFDSFSHMQPLLSVITHFMQNLLQTVTLNKITAANQHFLYMLVNIFTFNELWNVTFVTKQGVFVMYGDKTRAINFTR